MEETMTKGEYKFVREFNFGDYVFLNKANATFFPILSPVTDSQKEGGLCSFYATIDVLHTLLIIHEATSPPKQSQYFDSRFKDTPAVGQLLDSEFKQMGMLQTYLKQNGVTSEDHYNTRAEPNADLTEISMTGCIRFKTSRFTTFTGEDLRISVDCIEGADLNDVNDNFPKACINHIRRYGPVVGVFNCMIDADLMCEMPIYESKDAERCVDETGTFVAHAVMITGYGLAIHLPTGRMITYYVIQNNWGSQEEYVGRIPCHMFEVAYGHVMDKQQDLIQFSENQDSSNIAIIKREIAELGGLTSC